MKSVILMFAFLAGQMAFAQAPLSCVDTSVLWVLTALSK